MTGEKLTLRVTKGHCRGAALGDVYPDDILSAPEDMKVPAARRMIAIGYAVEIPREEEASPEVPEDVEASKEETSPEVPEDVETTGEEETSSEVSEERETSIDESRASEGAPGTVTHGDPAIVHGDPETVAPPVSKIKPPKRKKKLPRSRK